VETAPLPPRRRRLPHLLRRPPLRRLRLRKTTATSTATIAATPTASTTASFFQLLDFERRYFHKYETMKKLTVIAALGALAQETRLDIFRLLVQKGPEGLPAGEIGTRLGQLSPTMSFHLNQLRFAGLVSSRRESRSIIYSANFKTISDLLTYLTENCCGGRTELCAPVAAPGCASERAPQQTVISKKNRGMSI